MYAVEFHDHKLSQPANLRKKQSGGAYFCVYGTSYRMPIQQKLPPPVLLFRNFGGWDCTKQIAGYSRYKDIENHTFKNLR